ncbi:MAG: zinc ribbon domain-containing protein [Armatimonadetes bacterium]|nr:zinc ribbon domain-containing protein [Armatimonadota bacterium]
MRACPQCGQDVASGYDRCTSCGADLPPERPLRGYVLSVVALIAIILAALLLHSYLRQRVVRPPTDFLPSTAVMALDLDLRPESPAMLLLREKWSGDDIDRLGHRATQLAQDAVSLLGLDLDLREDVSRWFGGELAVASVSQADSPPLSPRNVVLVLRVIDLRQARRDLDRAIGELAQQHQWDRFSRRSDGRAIIFWGPSRDRSQIAYCASEGCVVMGASVDVVDLCLQAGRASAERLTDTADFRETRGELPGNAFFWGYSQTGELLHAASDLLPRVQKGWLEFIKTYLRDNETDRPASSPPATLGSFAFALLPETDGLSLVANHWRGTIEPPELPEPATQRLVDYVPRAALGYAFARDARGLVSALTPNPSGLHAQARPLSLLLRSPVGLFLRDQSIPKSVLVTALPGDHQPRLGVAMTGVESGQVSALCERLLSPLYSAQIEDVRLVGVDAECLRELRQAGVNPEDRLQIELDPDVYVKLWARPSALAPKVTQIEEIELTIRGEARGGTARLRLNADPGRLLGG